VTGVGRGAANLKLALERGAIDSIAADPAAAARDADLILVATPVAQTEKIFFSIQQTLGPGALVTDAGSTKRDVIAAARAGLGAKLAQFVPGHPIAGGERSGAAAAKADLFRGKRVVLTPLAENSRRDVEQVTAAWQACGARVTAMEAAAHDAVLAAVSHLPHLLAFALVHEIAGRADSAQLFGFAAGGFRDFTRIASSDPEMWRDICLANGDRLVEEVLGFAKKLREIETLLKARDGAGLEKLFAEARAARARWLSGEFE
jgi:prephenate dehydrogenase